MVHFGHRLCPTPKVARGLCRGERKVGLPTLQNLKGILGCPNLVSHLGDQAGAEVGGSRLPQWQGAPGRVFDGVQLPTKVPVGARLLVFAQDWDWLTSDSFVTSIVREGYQIELLSRPRSQPIRFLCPGLETRTKHRLCDPRSGPW